MNVTWYIHVRQFLLCITLKCFELRQPNEKFARSSSFLKFNMNELRQYIFITDSGLGILLNVQVNLWLWLVIAIQRFQKPLWINQSLLLNNLWSYCQDTKILHFNTFNVAYFVVSNLRLIDAYQSGTPNKYCCEMFK